MSLLYNITRVFVFSQVRVHEADTRHNDSANKMVSEIYLTRLLATKVRSQILYGICSYQPRRFSVTTITR